MSVFESEKEEKGTVSRQPAEETTVSDIENVLDFLDSEEYKEISEPTPRIKHASRQLAEPKDEKSGKTWALWLGAAAVIFSGIFILYKWVL